MAELRLSVLGPLTIEYGGKPLSDLTALKAQALLVYLGVTVRSHERQALAGLLWSDQMEELARTSLRKALLQLRKAVGDHVLADRHTIWFDRKSAHWIDAHGFEEACLRLQEEKPGDPATRKSLREAVYLYREGFLSGFRETDAVLFEEWVLGQQEYYRRLALDALQALAEDALARNDPDDGIEDARRMLSLDPLREEAHRTLMELYATAGNTIAALRQYDRCARILDAELSVPPSDDTVALAEALKAGRWIRGVDTEPAQPEQEELDVPVPNNLPVALTTLVGRQRELAELDKLLASDGVRLVSIVGPGGMGKTRLALAAAERQVARRRFSQGVYFAELAPLNGPEHILPVMTEAIRLPLQPGSGNGRMPKEQVLDYLRAKNMLLVLDNFEHLLAGADLVTDILQAASGVKILVTARERLLLPGEQVFPILGLDYGGADNGDSPDTCAAAQLFAQSARRAAPDLDLSAEELSQIVEICRLLEGMPLGIELAAAWVGLLPLDEIASELRSGSAILESDRRGVPARHRSIRAVFDATWQRLDEGEQTVFAALSVFRGGFSRTAAEQVAGASLGQLGDLAAKSLIQLDRAHNHYTLHEMVRQYGAEKLAGDPEWEARVRRRHSVRYCIFAQTLGENLLSARQMEAIAALEPKAENLRVAWQWALHCRDWQLVEQAMDGLGFFYEWQGRLQDGETAFEMACAALDAYGDAEGKNLLGKALTWRSVFDHAQGRTGAAEKHLAEALRLLAQAKPGDARLLKSEAFAWYQVGIQAFSRDDEKVRNGFARSLALYQRIAHKWGIARSLSGLAQADAEDGNYAAAESRFREALTLLREIGDRRSEAHSLHRLAILLRNAGSVEDAVSLARESYRLNSEMGDRAGIAWSGQILAECLNFAGVDAEAIELLHTAETLAADLGDSARLANVYQEQAMLLGRMKRYQEAYDKGKMGLALARRLRQPLRVALCQIMLAELELYAGEVEAAGSRLQESEQLMEVSASGHKMAIVYALQARVLLAQGERTRARQRTMASLRLSLQHRDYRVFLGLRALVLLLADAGRAEETITAFGHLAKWQNSALGLSESAIRQRIAPIMDQMSSQAVDDLLACARQSDAWEFVAHWVAELEQWVETDDMIVTNSS